MRIYILLFLALLFINVSCAQPVINPLAVDSIELKLVLSGTLTTENVESANLSLYIPQEGISKIDVNANWRYVYDKLGNKMVLLEWDKPKGRIEYKVEMILKNNAKHLSSEKKIGNDAKYLTETNSIVINDDIRKLAFPYEKSLQRAAELTMLVNNIVDYDISLSGQRKPSDWVLKNRRGVCAEHSNLLLSLLRASGIPARYVAGYAYSNLNKKFIGHAWVEVLAEDWVQFDPTWLQGGYLDATHIRTASLLDGNQSDNLMYRGGKIDWTKNDEEFTIMNYQEKNLTSINLASENFATNGYGYWIATIADECSIADIDTKSCVGENGEMLDMFDKNRRFWFCGEKELYWFFKASLDKEYTYSCPVVVYDQIGTSNKIIIELSGEKKLPDIFISGPNTVGINENFRLEASKDGIFYSPNLTRNSGRTWDLQLNKPGAYKFYLYSNGALAEKTVNVIEKKEFDLLVVVPSNATESFFVNVTVNNLLGDRKAKIMVEFDGKAIEEEYFFEADETKKFSFNLTAKSLGMKKVSVSILSDTITSYSSTIIIYEEEKEKTWWQSFMDSITKFFDSIGKFFSNLFK